MATSLVTFQSFGISASGTSKKSSPESRRSLSSRGRSLPIFGWTAEQPDYNINSSRSSSPTGSCSSGGDAVECGEDERKGRRFTPGNFTEEKARLLRMMTTGLEMSHEKMYHSAIASRLASDFSDRYMDDMI